METTLAGIVISESDALVNASSPMLSNDVHFPRLAVFKSAHDWKAPSPIVISPAGNCRSVIRRRAKLRAPIYFNEAGSDNRVIFCAWVGNSDVSFPSATPTVPSRTVNEAIVTLATFTSQLSIYNPLSVNLSSVSYPVLAKAA